MCRCANPRLWRDKLCKCANFLTCYFVLIGFFAYSATFQLINQSTLQAITFNSEVVHRGMPAVPNSLPAALNFQLSTLHYPLSTIHYLTKLYRRSVLFPTQSSTVKTSSWFPGGQFSSNSYTNVLPLSLLNRSHCWPSNTAVKFFNSSVLSMITNANRFSLAQFIPFLKPTGAMLGGTVSTNKVK